MRKSSPGQLDLFTGVNVVKGRCVATRATAEANKAAILADYLAGDSPRTIAARYSLGVGGVVGLLEREGVPSRTKSEALKGRSHKSWPRKRCLDESVFDVVNEGCAYWVGCLMGDGNVRIRDGFQPEIRLGLQERDADHIRLFRDFLKTDCKILISKPPPSQSLIAGHIVKAIQPQHSVTVSSQRLADALARHGVVPRKSLTARPSEEMADNRHFWRGMVDSDGTVRWHDSRGRHNNRYPSIYLCGSESCVAMFRDFARRIWPDLAVKYRPQGRIWVIHIVGRAAKAVAGHLYDDCSIALARKIAVAREFKTWEPKNRYVLSNAAAEIFRLAATEMRWSEIADAVGLSIDCVKAFYWRNGGTPRKKDPRQVGRRYTEAEDSMIRELLCAGHSIPDIARQMNRHRESVRTRIKYLGLA